MRWSEQQLRRYLKRTGQPDEVVPIPKIRLRTRRYHGLPPQQILEQEVECLWPGQFEFNTRKLIPGRRFEADLCHRELHLVIEVDGFANHGHSLGGFYRDRIKDKILYLHDWEVLRIPAGSIRKDLPDAIKTIEQYMEKQREKLGLPAPEPRDSVRHNLRVVK